MSNIFYEKQYTNSYSDLDWKYETDTDELTHYKEALESVHNREDDDRIRFEDGTITPEDIDYNDWMIFERCSLTKVSPFSKNVIDLSERIHINEANNILFVDCLITTSVIIKAMETYQTHDLKDLVFIDCTFSIEKHLENKIDFNLSRHSRIIFDNCTTTGGILKLNTIADVLIKKSNMSIKIEKLDESVRAYKSKLNLYVNNINDEPDGYDWNEKLIKLFHCDATITVFNSDINITTIGKDIRVFSYLSSLSICGTISTGVYLYGLQSRIWYYGMNYNKGSIGSYDIEYPYTINDSTYLYKRINLENCITNIPEDKIKDNTHIYEKFKHFIFSTYEKVRHYSGINKDFHLIDVEEYYNNLKEVFSNGNHR